MAQTRTAKGTAAAGASGTTLTVPDVSMVGGDYLIVAAAWDIDESANPDMVFGNNELVAIGGVTISTGHHRVRICAEIINNTRTKDVVVTWPSAVTGRVMIVTSLHQAGKFNITDENENLATTISTSGAKDPIDHIQTVHLAFHLTNGPSGDNTGSSSTGHTLGQRIGTTLGTAADVTLQERYKIIAASTITAGNFVVDETYQIQTVGTTDFTAIGAASNTVGVVFVATGIGSGTGDAYHMQEERSRVSSLTTRDHAGIMFFFRPKQTFTITRMEQQHRNMNHNPDWVFVGVEDESGNGFEFRIDPDLFDDWSDAVVAEYVSKIASVWVTNNIDSNLVYEADTARDARMATFINDQVVL